MAREKEEDESLRSERYTGRLISGALHRRAPAQMVLNVVAGRARALLEHVARYCVAVVGHTNVRLGRAAGRPSRWRGTAQVWRGKGMAG